MITGVCKLLFPEKCGRCGAETETRGLCAACWSHLHFFSQTSCCVTCGFPLAVTPPPNGEAPFMCGVCLQTPPPLEAFKSVLVYDAGSRPLLLKYKHGRELSLTPLFVDWLLTYGKGLLEEADLILPVPLHWWRLFRRRFNQAAVLAQKLAQRTGVMYAPHVLKRYRHTPSQGHTSRQARLHNVQRAFRVPPKRRPWVQGKRILLIDDVRTTGATLHACARTLLKAGAQSVTALTVARASPDTQIYNLPKTL